MFQRRVKCSFFGMELLTMKNKVRCILLPHNQGFSTLLNRLQAPFTISNEFFWNFSSEMPPQIRSDQGNVFGVKVTPKFYLLELWANQKGATIFLPKQNSYDMLSIELFLGQLFPKKLRFVGGFLEVNSSSCIEGHSFLTTPSVASCSGITWFDSLK